MSSLRIAEFTAHLHDAENTEKVINVSWEKQVGPDHQSGYVVTEYEPPKGTTGAMGIIVASTEIYATLCNGNEYAAEDRAMKAALKRYRQLREEGRKNFQAWMNKHKEAK